MSLPSPLLALGAALLRAHHGTLRLRGLLADGTEVSPATYPFGGEVFALSEGDALALAGFLARARMTVLIARGRDGDWATGLASRLGARVVRGSTRRGGERALRELLDGEAGGPAAIVVDGPLGPRGVAKGGALLLGWRTGRPVRALGVAASRTWVFERSWSRLHLPLPFATVAIALEAPIAPPPAGVPARAALDAATAELTRRLAVARERAEALLRGQPRPSPFLSALPGGAPA